MEVVMSLFSIISYPGALLSIHHRLFKLAQGNNLHSVKALHWGSMVGIDCLLALVLSSGFLALLFDGHDTD